MVKALTLALLLLSFTAQAQDLNLAGKELEKAGKRRNTALIVAGFTGLLIVAMPKDDAMPLIALGAMGATVTISLNISANQKEKKAGRLLQY